MRERQFNLLASRIVILLLIALVCSPGLVHAQAVEASPRLTVAVEGADDGELALSIQIVLLMTMLTLAPALIMLTTSFTRIIIVLGFLRQAIGTPQMPSNQILVGLALFLSVVIMMPVIDEIREVALDPYLEKTLSQKEAATKALEPIKAFMLHHTREKDLTMFLEITGSEVPVDRSDLKLSVVVPSFITSELKTAFQMGFLLYIPFLIVDMVVASVLMSMGMMMLPPILISLPFKILLFVMVDGWHLITRSLVTAFAVTS